MNRLHILLLLLLPFSLFSQTPKRYFQQEVNYKINVALDDTKHSLTADIELEYINHSNDTLQNIWFHLWPNAYKDRNSALCKQLVNSGDPSLYFANEEERGYIDNLNFTVDNQETDWEYDKEHQDICVLHLKKPLLPGNRIFIRTPFFVKLPSAEFSRLGHIGQAYAITQWYPKPAVYDQRGWHPMPYLTQGEFYSEYGSFEVSITLPSNYVVGATGDLQTASEIEWMDMRSKEKLFLDPKNLFPPSSTEKKTITFKQQNIHDFAWFADKRFHVAKGEVTLPRTGKKVTTLALYTNAEPEIWNKATEYINDALLYYSDWVGDYPYNQCTAVDGTIAAGGGMEYPNVTIIGTSDNAFLLETVIAHEVGHNWFYGILGSNEREHPWMDEGMNSLIETRYVLKKYPPERFGNQNELSASMSGGKILGLDKLNYHQSALLEYQTPASIKQDQPIEGHATDYTMINYGAVVYKKTALAFEYLLAYLGEDVFNKCMTAYFDAWKFRHPYPENVKEIFEKNSGKNLDWFFNGLIPTNTRQDFALRNTEIENGKISFTVEQKSGIPAPFIVSGLNNEGQVINEAWFEADKIGQIITMDCQSCSEILLDRKKVMLEVKYTNNDSRCIELPKIHLFPKVHNKDENHLYITPAIGWNQYNGFMAGLAFYNQTLPFSKLEYSIIPMYGFRNKSITGIAGIHYSILPDKTIFKEIKISNEFRMFSYGTDEYRAFNSDKLTTADLTYKRYSPTLTFNFRKSTPTSTFSTRFILQSVHLWEDNIVYQFYTDKPFAIEKTIYKDFYRARLQLSDRRSIDPYSFSIGTELNKDVGKVDLEFKYKISYKRKGKGATFRLFAGGTFEDKVNGLYGYFLSDRNAARGSTDYAYDDWYFGRTATDGLLYHQIALRQGAFKSYSPLGSYRDYIAALNITLDFPIPLPIRFYADFGTTDRFKEDVKAVYDINTSISYSAGLSISLSNETVEIFFPLFKSAEIKKYNETNKINFGEQIRFVFNIANMKPGNIRNQLKN